MVVHYFTLAGLAAELDGLSRGAVITEIFTQQKNELGLTLEHSGATTAITISIEPGSNHIFWRQQASRAKRNSTDLFPGATGSAISGVRIHPSDRTIIIQFANNTRLLCSLYNTASSNVLLANASDVVLDAFKRSKSIEGTAVDLRPEGSENPLDGKEVFIRMLRSAGGTGLLQSLRNILPTFGTLYAREALVRSGLEDTAGSEASSDEALARIFDAARSIVAECAAGRAHIYTHGKREPVLACCLMQHLREWTYRELPTVNEGVRAVVSVISQVRQADSEQGSLAKKLLSRREHLEKSLRTCVQQVEESRRAGEYTRNGNLLTANIHLLKKGMDAADVEDVYGDGGKVRIAMSASLTPAENAERYFTKARKARGSGEEAAARILEIKADLKPVDRLIGALADCVDDEGLDRFRNEHREELTALNIVEKSAPQERVPYRKFPVPGGYEVWVGKSSADNDELTFRYAKPHDIWFHVRGASGSHAILRVPGKQQAVPKEAILAAARIAAYYSKMKKGSTVPVAYCERKYVRKPKGAPPGAVTLEREKVVFVDPSLP